MELNPNMNKLLTEPIISLLNKQDIFTVIDFVKEDLIKLEQTTKLDRDVITLIKNDFFTLFNPHEGFGFETQTVKTGIQSFDNLLGGGLKSGSLYDICGLSGSGKTQICNSIAVNLAMTYKYETLYVDAKNDFSGQRIYNMLKARNCCDAECGLIMNRIRCESIYDVNQFLSILRDVSTYLDEHELTKCLIVDSMPSLWFPLLDGKDNGVSLLAEAANLMHKMAFTHNMIVLLVNIVTRKTETNLDSFDQSERYKTKVTVALGKYWHTVPRQRFLLARTDDMNSQSTSKRTVKIIEREGKGRTCDVEITNTGVV